jgi:hypothetical protein
LQKSKYAATGIDPDSISALTRLLNEYPNDLGVWHALNQAYINEEVMYREDERGMIWSISPAIDHHQGYAKAIVLALAYVRRWPNYYHGWWDLSSNLSSYASLVRGTKYWSSVPEAARVRYKNITEVSEYCLSEAIKRHPMQGRMYAAMIQFDVHNGRDWMATFRKAAGLDPHRLSIYRTAFNYARPQWGGSTSDMSEIYRLAKKNNPDEEWPRQLRDAWAKEIKPLVDFDNPRIKYGSAVLFVSFVVFGVWLYQRRRSSSDI